MSELSGDTPVVIKVSADWCQPCRRLDPTIKELSIEYEGRIKFLSLDTDNEQELATTFQISSIPTLLFLKKGSTIDRLIGVRSKTEIVEKIEEMLK